MRLQIRPLLDEALDELWTAGFALIEAAEAAADCVPSRAHLANRLSGMGDELWRSLDTADELYCVLAQLCATLETPGTGR